MIAQLACLKQSVPVFEHLNLIISAAMVCFLYYLFKYESKLQIEPLKEMDNHVP